MIIIEFIIFVVSSGLFCSERFRNHFWAVLVAGAIATGSSLLFFYHMGAKMMGKEPTPAVITRIVKVPVVKTVLPSQSASAPKDKPHTCGVEFYPSESLAKGEEGNTKVSFKILTDGTVEGVSVADTSGSQRLDDAAVACVKTWHYRPAIKDGKLAEVNSGAVVKWILPTPAEVKMEAAAKAEEKKDDKKPEDLAPAAEAPNEGQKSHAWYDPRGWFSSSAEAEKKQHAEADKKLQTQAPQP
ncbi:energy transducer TonB [Rhizomicrobium electricum]|uniref:TonB C-terminal domain-containing protein n=1 Tax=Rhizomicrobium electricum TaxID=480070 RepID=A0ABN1EZ57_9PROT|nr:energy transducer TonB [Rhizomicrobium electricum]NIJ49862.1 TonB family protein [Rhizomicrobium electricum]